MLKGIIRLYIKYYLIIFKDWKLYSVKVWDIQIVSMVEENNFVKNAVVVKFVSMVKGKHIVKNVVVVRYVSMEE